MPGYLATFSSTETEKASRGFSTSTILLPRLPLQTSYVLSILPSSNEMARIRQFQYKGSIHQV